MNARVEVHDTCWTTLRTPMACQRLALKLLRDLLTEDENGTPAQELGKEGRDGQQPRDRHR